MPVSPIAALLLLFWLVMPCLLGPQAAALLGFRTTTRPRVSSSQPAAVTLSRLYRGRRPTSTSEDRHAH